MKFTSGLWTHQNFRDVHFYVTSSYERPYCGENVSGYWVRRDFGCGSLILKDDYFWVNMNQFDQWSRV